tara:strand:- start:464 stop:580 length:117 start_codon:yes stop_codon:yes gene_type:complete
MPTALVLFVEHQSFSFFTLLEINALGEVNQILAELYKL